MAVQVLFVSFGNCNGLQLGFCNQIRRSYMPSVWRKDMSHSHSCPFVTHCVWSLKAGCSLRSKTLFQPCRIISLWCILSTLCVCPSHRRRQGAYFQNNCCKVWCFGQQIYHPELSVWLDFGPEGLSNLKVSLSLKWLSFEHPFCKAWNNVLDSWLVVMIWNSRP